jgi:hypothetical protein
MSGLLSRQLNPDGRNGCGIALGDLRQYILKCERGLHAKKKNAHAVMT